MSNYTANVTIAAEADGGIKFDPSLIVYRLHQLVSAISGAKIIGYGIGFGEELFDDVLPEQIVMVTAIFEEHDDVQKFKVDCLNLARVEFSQRAIGFFNSDAILSCLDTGL